MSMPIATAPVVRTLPPGSSGLPIIGETLHLLLDPHFFERRAQRYGRIFSTHIVGAPLVVVVGAEANHHILRNPDHIFEAWLPANMHALVGNAVVTQERETHDRTRRLLAPAFHKAALMRYYETMQTVTHSYLERWMTRTRFAWHTEFKRFAAEIACRVFLGVEGDADVARVVGLFDLYSRGFTTVMPVRGGWTTFGKALEARAALLRYLEGAIAERRAHPTDDALSMLIAATDDAGNHLDDAAIMSEALLLIFAGHETTATFLTFTVWEMSRNPDMWQTLRDEQDGFGAGAVEAQHLHRMPEMDRFMKEVERLHSPAIGSFRRTVKDFEFDGYCVPAGTNVMYTTVGTHRDSTVFPDPARFNPERYIDPTHPTIPPLGLIGYGGGERSCLGFGFAQMEMKLMVAALLRHHTWRVARWQNLTIAPLPTTHLRSGLRVRFAARDTGHGKKD